MTTTQLHTINVKLKQFATQFQYSVIALALLSVCPLRALAQDGHSHPTTSQNQEQASEQRRRANALIKIVRESTERYKDVSAAEADGYALQFGCVSGPDSAQWGCTM